MLGIAESKPDKRMEWNLKALAYAEEKPKAKRWLGSLFNNIGWAQVEAGNLEEAFAIQQKLLAETKADGEPSGYVYEELAECLLQLDRNEEARHFFSRCYDRFTEDTWLMSNEPERMARIKDLAGR
ncbi:hypothetical protein [Paenibacillus caui]|uniref:hypothetical protein n=1 Tax=Paenibacillus caui TaxID=2873927 RepID=UPI001CA9B786|nr:hypothetical protein [Paenibacillus caui]